MFVVGRAQHLVMVVWLLVVNWEEGERLVTEDEN